MFAHHVYKNTTILCIYRLDKNQTVQHYCCTHIGKVDCSVVCACVCPFAESGAATFGVCAIEGWGYLEMPLYRASSSLPTTCRFIGLRSGKENLGTLYRAILLLGLPLYRPRTVYEMSLLCHHRSFASLFREDTDIRDVSPRRLATLVAGCWITRRERNAMLFDV